MVNLVHSPRSHVSEGLQRDDPAGPTVVQVPRVEGNSNGFSHVVVPHHADEEWDHVDRGHDSGASTEFSHQRSFCRCVELVVRADAAVPREVESAVQNIREDVSEKQDAVDS